eukprot:PhF_6_TR31475/c4_g2_i1/m.46249
MMRLRGGDVCARATVEAIATELCLFPTVLVLPPPAYPGFPQYRISQLNDCLGSVPFEQSGNQLLLGRPTVCPVPTVEKVLREDRPVDVKIKQPLIRLKILKSDDVTAEPILAEIKGSDLTVVNMTTLPLHSNAILSIP